VRTLGPGNHVIEHRFTITVEDAQEEIATGSDLNDILTGAADERTSRVGSATTGSSARAARTR